MDANPWLVENIQTFSFLNCPECTFKSKGVVISESTFNFFPSKTKCKKPLALTFHLQVNHFQRVPFVQQFLKKGQPHFIRLLNSIRLLIEYKLQIKL